MLGLISLAFLYDPIMGNIFYKTDTIHEKVMEIVGVCEGKGVKIERNFENFYLDDLLNILQDAVYINSHYLLFSVICLYLSLLIFRFLKNKELNIPFRLELRDLIRVLGQIIATFGLACLVPIGLHCEYL